MSACGRTLQDPSGYLGSPYHHLTGNNSVKSADEDGEKCEWRIVATHGETIILNVTDFDLPYSDGCKYDYLEIRDGYWHKSPLLGNYCTSNLK
jgi:tolkin protein